MNPTAADRPKPKPLIALSVVGLLGSLLLGLPIVLTLLFAALLVVFLLHGFIMK